MYIKLYKNKASLALFLYKYNQPTIRLQTWTSCRDKTIQQLRPAVFLFEIKKKEQFSLQLFVWRLRAAVAISF